MATDPDAYPMTSRPWQDQVVGFIRNEIDQGRLVRVHLPGSLRPVPLEDAAVMGCLVALTGPQDSMFVVGDLQGLVVLSDAQPGSVRWPKHASEISMDVDQDVTIRRFGRDGEVRRDGIDEA